MYGLAGVFEHYTPVRFNNNNSSNPSLVDLGKTSYPVHSRKGLRLLQTNPLMSKDLFNHHFFFKYVMTKVNLHHSPFSKQGWLTTDYLFRDNMPQLVKNTDLNPAPAFKYEIRRRLVKSFAVSKFTPKVTPWYLTNLVRFIEYCSGRKVSVRLDPFIANSLTFTDKAKCHI